MLWQVIEYIGEWWRDEDGRYLLLTLVGMGGAAVLAGAVWYHNHVPIWGNPLVARCLWWLAQVVLVLIYVWAVRWLMGEEITKAAWWRDMMIYAVLTFVLWRGYAGADAAATAAVVYGCILCGFALNFILSYAARFIEGGLEEFSLEDYTWESLRTWFVIGADDSGEGY